MLPPAIRPKLEAGVGSMTKFKRAGNYPRMPRAATRPLRTAPSMVAG